MLWGVYPILPNNKELVAQMTSRLGWPNSRGKLELESKQAMRARNLPSPGTVTPLNLSLLTRNKGLLSVARRLISTNSDWAFSFAARSRRFSRSSYSHLIHPNAAASQPLKMASNSLRGGNAAMITKSSNFAFQPRLKDAPSCAWECFPQEFRILSGRNSQTRKNQTRLRN